MPNIFGTYIHNHNARLVEFVHDLLRRNTNGAYEELRLFLNDNINELR
jgi:hypothetical protein